MKREEIIAELEARGVTEGTKCIVWDRARQYVTLPWGWKWSQMVAHEFGLATKARGNKTRILVDLDPDELFWASPRLTLSLDPKEIAIFTKYLIDQRGYKITKIAEEMGVNPNTIYNLLEAKKGTSIDTINKLCRKFGISFTGKVPEELTK